MEKSKNCYFEEKKLSLPIKCYGFEDNILLAYFLKGVGITEKELEDIYLLAKGEKITVTSLGKIKLSVANKIKEALEFFPRAYMIEYTPMGAYDSGMTYAGRGDDISITLGGDSDIYIEDMDDDTRLDFGLFAAGAGLTEAEGKYISDKIENRLPETEDFDEELIISLDKIRSMNDPIGDRIISMYTYFAKEQVISFKAYEKGVEWYNLWMREEQKIQKIGIQLEILLPLPKEITTIIVSYLQGNNYPFTPYKSKDREEIDP